ncbi:hypothetical protein PI124_g11804 [Phytophthora idaei]|nr:hypothetical protein PI125_g4161 [Phytophthora idaei]KAG3166781.1 hypothetical protein PI126_g4053 [Phytophthora idaei]KAG3243379.1 hypothetical protein PI124_g11804 [Phytophthora idaei]
MAKKRRRSESFQADDDDARKRLAAFHARMFELPQEDAPVPASVTPRVVFKAKSKKHKKKSGDTDDGEPVPMVKFNKMKIKKEKKKKVVTVAEKKLAMGPAVVKVPGMPKGVKNKPQEKKKGKKEVKKTTVQTPQWNSMKNDDGVDPLKQPLGSVIVMVTQKKVKKVKKTTVPAPQRHSMKKEKDEDNDGVDPLEQALGSVNAMVMKQGAKPPVVAVPSIEKPNNSVEIAEEKNATAEFAVNNNTGDDVKKPISKKIKKRRKNKKKALEANNSDPASGNLNARGAEVANEIPAVCEKGTESESTVKTTANGSASSKATAPSPKSPSSQKKRKKSVKVNSMNSVSPKTQTLLQPRQGKPLIVSDEAESQTVSKTIAPKDSTTVLFKTVKIAPATNGTAAAKVATSNKKIIPNVEKKNVAHTKPMTPIAASLANAVKKKNDMFLPAQETQRQPAVSSKHPQKAVPPQVVQLHDASSSSESEHEGGFEFNHRDSDSLFSRLIDSAARERWELVEVGRLVRLFAAEWDFKESKTAHFLIDTCPELVSVDFLEGLGVNLSAKQLVQVFEAGSGNSGVLMNKMASAVENGHLSVRDPSFVSALERRVALMESNTEVMELLHPLLESLSTVRDVGYLLKQLCEHWQLERKVALVQQVLLSSIFDDLDGNQDDILLDLPDLNGRLDFPSRLDQEDVDENGNLKGFLANEDSEYSGEERSEQEEDDEKDSDEDEDPYEGETDSDEEMEISGCSRSRNQFIEDEADVGEEDEEEENERHNDDGSSSSDSD